jgi:hypothetical protein
MPTRLVKYQHGMGFGHHGGGYFGDPRQLRRVADHIAHGVGQLKDSLLAFGHRIAFALGGRCLIRSLGMPLS